MGEKKFFVFSVHPGPGCGILFIIIEKAPREAVGAGKGGKMKLGICTGLENAGLLAELGYDYMETGLAAVAAMSREEFGRARAALAGSGLSCEAMNGMLPGEVPVVGEQADPQRVEAYLTAAFARAGELGARVIVFGSGGSRRVPEGFPPAGAWRQIRDYLRLADGLAGAHGLQIAIEPLRREECNILNRVSEAVELAAVLDLPHVGVLGDTYHMWSEGEPLSVLKDAGELLRHVHIACPEGRRFPRENDPADARGEYAALFRTLEEAGYEGRISIEAGTRALSEDGAASLGLLRARMGR